MPSDDFSGGRSVLGASGGLSQTKYIVEREVPPDGLLGTHQGSFFTEELGQIYGSGIYVITRQEPGKMPQQFRQKVSESYGAPKFPKHLMGGSRDLLSRSPFRAGAWGHAAGQSGHEDERAQPYRQVPYFPRQEGLSRRPDETNSIDKAFDTVKEITNRSIEEIERARKTGPDQFVTSFMREQQEIANRRFEEERSRLAEEKKEEQEKWDRQQRSDRERWERDQAAAREHHERELQRIKAENEAREKFLRAESEEREKREARDREEREKRAAEERRFLLDLQDQKMAMLKQQADAERQRLSDELVRNQDQMKEMAERTSKTIEESQRATTSHIEESQRQIQEQLEREREQLDREHKLKEKALDREGELQGKILDAQRAVIDSQGGDHVFNTVNTLVKELSKAMSQVVDLKKIEAMSPEAQAVHIAKSGPGVPQEPPQQERGQEPKASMGAQPEAAPAEGAPQETPVSPAQAQMQATVQGAVQQRIEDVIRENLKTPLLKDVLSEWALHVEDGAQSGIVNATAFANFYIQLMQDEKSYETRKACAAFATFMKPRTWKKVYGIIREALDESQQKIFDLPQAEEFYKQFKRLVLDQIMQYFQQFYNGADVPGGAAPGAQPQAPVEPQGARQETPDEAAGNAGTAPA